MLRIKKAKPTLIRPLPIKDTEDDAGKHLNFGYALYETRRDWAVNFVIIIIIIGGLNITVFNISINIIENVKLNLIPNYLN